MESELSIGPDESDDALCLPPDRYETDAKPILRESSDRDFSRFRLIEWLVESPNREITRQRKQAVAALLEVSTRQVERLVKKFHVGELGLKQGEFPHQATVFRVLQPLVEQQRRRKKIRNPGSGSRLVVQTRNGQSLKAEFSNQIVQCDHTKLDILVGYRDDDDSFIVVGRPWLTTIVDTFSSYVLGFFLGMKQPGSHEVTLALRHAALPKQYPQDYELVHPWAVGEYHSRFLH